MKKLTFLSLLAFVFVLASCSKEEEKKDSLDGTAWEASIKNGANELLFTLSFKATTFELINNAKYDNDEDGTVDETDTETVSGTYIYNPPTVILTSDDETNTLTVNGNTMTLADIETGDISLTFKKK
ncbi:MAG: hypothetical protein LBQ65_02110 [Tannerellaceae bacterium]|jgi:hypothetical protein|nr:hypothetical protein [Tannerellaceae bacterium]